MPTKRVRIVAAAAAEDPPSTRIGLGREEGDGGVEPEGDEDPGAAAEADVEEPASDADEDDDDPPGAHGFAEAADLGCISRLRGIRGDVSRPQIGGRREESRRRRR
mmetsp:Transcript_29841/g.88600  ORF Transcript_29841/g.88600 Transcript_29841/m.88600 type:complete len:106 (-) Transcript_29841:2377-2694(-)